MASLPVPDELVAEIFLRLPTAADLVRASASCVSFRRVAAHRSFVRRFRKIHVPPLLGLLDGDQTFHPAVPPHTRKRRRTRRRLLLPPRHSPRLGRPGQPRRPDTPPQRRDHRDGGV
ncbi:hypothetical protein ACQ4PT_015784 [Festuca glaucescens]